jgi:hypothetical protein
MAKWLSWAQVAIGALGVFTGAVFLNSLPVLAVYSVTVACVGVVGILGFIQHVFFHRSEAQRLGWDTSQVDWAAYEVGFANLAFGVTGLVAVFGGWGGRASAAVLFAYALYLFQATGLHTYHYFSKHLHDRTWAYRNIVGAGAAAALMLSFAVWGIVAAA